MSSLVIGIVGIVLIRDLFKDYHIPDNMKHYFISLLEKFELGLRITSSQVLVPSLTPPTASFPEPMDTSTFTVVNDEQGEYQPPLTRFWMTDFVHHGFWPRLICRVTNDHQIGKVSPI